MAGSHAQVLHGHVPVAVSAGKAVVVETLPAEQLLNFSIVLPLRHEDELDLLLGRLYDPSTADYRRFLSVAEFTEKFGPTPDDYQAVVSFAKAHGFEVTGTPANRMVVPVKGTVDQVNKAFHLTMNVYRHPSEDRTFFSPDREPSLTLPAAVAHIAGLNNFSIPKPMVKRSQNFVQAPNVMGSGPSGSYLASDMRAAYYGGTTLDGNGQTVGLLEFGGYDMSDVDLTFSNAGQSYGVPVNNVLLDGADGGPDGYGDAEQVLDIVQAIGMAPGLSQVRVYIGIGSDDANILNSMASENIAKSLSCSWGWKPEDPGTDDPFFKEFAAQGQSFFVASGDSGALDSAIDPYFFPAEDANITAVGGTHLTTSVAGGSWASETAWNDLGAGSGGGISPGGLAIPSWQAGLATTANGGSTTLRNVPDVAMEGDFDNYVCELGYCDGGWAGTSFAAPRWAAFVALVNQQAVEAGNAPKGGIGFLNPAIYAIGKGANYTKEFHDITEGNNDTAGQPVWFNAVTGYDLVTGWGSATGQGLIDDLAGKQVPGFWMSASVPTVDLKLGGTGTTTVSIAGADGFSGSVSLALASALPAGVTAAWSANPTSGSSVLTIKASATAIAGTSTLTITGTSGKLTATTRVTIVVHGPTFTLTSAPQYILLNPGGSGTSTITLTPEYGFTGSANLSLSGLPSGVTASFSPSATSGTSILTLKASATAAVASSTLTITGTSGALKVTTTLYLQVAKPTFTLQGPTSLTMGQNATAGAYLYINPEYGFTGNVTLSVAGLPSGVTGYFSSNPTTGSSELVLTSSSTAAVGTKTVTITGTSGNVTANTSFPLSVMAPTFEIAGPLSGTLGVGTSAPFELYVNPEYGFTGNVSLAITGLPTGVTASFSPNPGTGNITLTLTAGSAVTPATSTLKVTGTYGKLTSSFAFSLGVFKPTFTLSSQTTNLNIGRGASLTTPITVNPEYGFSGYVTLSLSGLPQGVTATLAPNPTTGYSILTLTASATAPLTTGVLTITGVSGNLKQTITLPIGVYTQNFALASQGDTTIGQGGSTATSIYVTPENGFTGSVFMAAAGLPQGVTASFSTNPTAGGTTMTLTASSTTPVGAHAITVTGTSGNLSSKTAFTLTTYAPSFTLTSQQGISLGQGSSQTTSVTVIPENGFTGSANLAVSGLPSGVTASFSPNPTNRSSMLTLVASNTAAVGNSTLTITGKYGNIAASTTLSLSIVAPSFTVSAPGIIYLNQGNTAGAGIVVNALNGFTGAVQFAIAGLPAGVTASFTPSQTTTYSSLLLTASSAAAPGTYAVTITGKSGAQTQMATTSVTVVAPTFTIGSPGAVVIGQGSSNTNYLFIQSANGFTGSVTLAASGLPSGVSASFSPNPSTEQVEMILSATNTATLGMKTVTITGTSGKQSISTTFPITIVQPTFSFGYFQDISMVPGTTANLSVEINPEYGFQGSVKLAVAGLPSGVTASSFVPNPVAANGESSLTLTASSTAKQGTYKVTITGTSGTQTASVVETLTIAEPSFTLYTYPPNLPISQGSTVSTNVYVNATNNFQGNVSFGVSGLPSGVTVSIGRNSQGQPSLLEFTASPTASIGTKTLTITGTSGTQQATTTIALSVYPPSFTLDASSNGSLVQGGSLTSYVGVRSDYGFTGNVSLSLSGLPNGVTAAFSTNPTSSGSSVLTLQASKTASVGQYIVTVKGTYGALTAFTTFPITVVSPSFSFYGLSDVSIGRGSAVSSNVSFYPQNGFTGNVLFSVSGLPAGVSAAFSSNPTASYTVLKLAASNTAALGLYTATITAHSGTQTVSSNFTVGVYTPSFTVSYGGSETIETGSSTTGTAYVNPLYGFTGSVTFGLSGLPSGVTGSFAANPTTGSSVLTLKASTSAIPGQYNATLTGSSAGKTVSVALPILIDRPSFSLDGPYSLSIGRGSTTSGQVYVETFNGFTGSVRFAVSGLPSGVTASFSPNPTSSGSTTMTLQAYSAASLGEYNALITATSGTQTASTMFSVTVYVPTFTISPPYTPNLGQGAVLTSSAGVQAEYGFNGSVELSLSGLPDGVTATVSPNPIGPSNYYPTITFKASSTAALGQYNVLLTGTSGSQTSSASFTLGVYAPTFSLYASPQSIDRGGSGASYVQIEPAWGFNKAITLSVSGLPSGVNGSFSLNPTTTLASTLTMAVSSTTKPGTYYPTVTGVSGNQTSSNVFMLEIQ